MNLSKCLRQTAAHPCGRTHRFRSKILEKVSPRGPKSTKLGPKIYQAGLQTPPSWSPKSCKIGPRRSLGGVWGRSWFQDCPDRHQDTFKWRYLGASWRRLGGILGHLGDVLGHPGNILGDLGGILRHLGTSFFQYQQVYHY